MSLERTIANVLNMDVGEMIENEPLYKHTSLRVGGPCRLYVKVKDLSGLEKLLAYLKKHHTPYYVIGRGSNLLFCDREYEGVIISLNECFTRVEVNGTTVKAEAGVGLIRLSGEVCKYGLSGLEFAGGIPASVGGAVFMNAGAYLSEMADLVREVTVLDENGEIVHIDKNDAEFGYRRSLFQKHPEWIILEAVLQLKPGDPRMIKALMDKRKEKRMTTQPWNMPSAGSIFTNPQTIPAWQCIDGVGLRGFEIGGAQFSPKHSNFIVNNGYASARDILALIQLAKKEVRKKYDIDLTTEVRLVNWP